MSFRIFAKKHAQESLDKAVVARQHELFNCNYSLIYKYNVGVLFWFAKSVVFRIVMIAGGFLSRQTSYTGARSYIQPRSLSAYEDAFRYVWCIGLMQGIIEIVLKRKVGWRSKSRQLARGNVAGSPSPMAN